MQNYGVPVASGFVAVRLYIWNTTENDQTNIQIIQRAHLERLVVGLRAAIALIQRRMA
jgi:hypothetical protein